MYTAYKRGVYKCIHPVSIKSNSDSGAAQQSLLHRWKWVQVVVVVTILCIIGTIVQVVFWYNTTATTTTTTTTTTSTTTTIHETPIIYHPKDDVDHDYISSNANLHYPPTPPRAVINITFHLAFTVPTFTKLNQRCIESILYFHPKAHIKIHSNAQSGIHTVATVDSNNILQPIQQLIDLGYHIEIIPYTATDILHRAISISNSIVNSTLATTWISKINTQYSLEPYWYSNESNLLRLCLLYVEGGIYLDTDVILVRPMVAMAKEEEVVVGVESSTTTTINDRRKKNTITDNIGLNIDNVMARDGGSFECAVMKFLSPNNIFLGYAINNFLDNYNGIDWGNNGPRVFGRTSHEVPHLLCPEPYNFTKTITITNIRSTTMDQPQVSSTSTIQLPQQQLPCAMQPLPSYTFQPVPWRKWLTYCFDSKKSPVGINATRIVRRPNVYAVHMNNHIFGNEIEKHIYVHGSLCDIVLTKFCILCT